MNTSPMHGPAGARVVGLLFVLLGLWSAGNTSYQFIRFRSDPAFRQSTIDQMANDARERIIAEHGGRAVLMPDEVERIQIDRAKVEAALDEQSRTGVTRGGILGVLFAIAGAVMASRLRARRAVGLISGAVSLLLGLGYMTSAAHRDLTALDWSGVAFFLGLGVATILVFRRKLSAPASAPANEPVETTTNPTSS